MSRRSWLSAAVVVGLVAVPLMPSPASATIWPVAPICVKGAVTAGERTFTTPGRTPLVLTFQPCAGTAPAVVDGARWIVAQYSRREAYAMGHLEEFWFRDRPMVVLTNGYVDGQLGQDGHGRVRAACLITDANTRVACVALSETGSGHTTVIEPLAVDDPRVSRTVTYYPPDPDHPDPECAACV